ncbi:tripartite tricarboxylate transporter TctB family protein [Phytohabitans kaempferiae]|uniref:Tripartite tricarboxylate transporter TctB family protein n=1 Tax=Phytohabitans kaempferiae TaxID=1620943 RepID=A0ABV6MA24_9ACTN
MATTSTQGEPVGEPGPDQSGSLRARLRARTGSGHAVAAAGIGLAVLVLVQTSDLPRSSDIGGPGSGLWPQLLAVFILVMAAVIALRHRRAGTDDEQAPVRPDGLLRILVAALLVILYGVAWQYLHFVIVTPLLIAGLSYVLGLRSWPALTLFPVGVSLVLYGLFATGFGIAL